MRHKKIPGRAIHGAAVELSALPVDDAAKGGWNILAYEVDMESGIKLTKADFEACVSNFTKYPKVPVVIEHADTELFGNAQWAEPRGWVTELKVGTFARPDGRTVASLEGRLQVGTVTRTEINGSENDPPKWPFGSVTVFQGKDEETGKSVGMCLWSFSLTAHPRLIDVPRLAASLPGPADGKTTAGYYWGTIETRDDLVEALRQIFELPVLAPEADVLAALDQFEALATGEQTDAQGVDLDRLTRELREALRLPALSTVTDVIAEVRRGLATVSASAPETLSRPAVARPPVSGESTMKWLEFAAKYGLVAKDEDDAREKVLAHVSVAAELMTALGAKTPAEGAARLSALQAEAAKVSGLTQELETLRKERDARLAAERAAHIDEVMAAEYASLPPERAASLRKSFELHAKHDWEGFKKENPRPSREELAQRAQDPARLERLPGANTRAPASRQDGPTADDLTFAAHTLIEHARERGQSLSFADALEMLADAGHAGAAELPEANDQAAE